MRIHNNKLGNQILSLLMALVMVVSMLPMSSFTAFAADGAATTETRSIMLGTSHITGGQASNIYFGNYQQSSLGNTEPTEGTEGVDWINSTTATQNSQGPYYKIEPIKWRVLSNADGKLFLLSDQNLDVFRYHTEYETVRWETSTMRSWLNGYDAASNINSVDYSNDNFINAAFGAAEKGVIADTTVINATYDGTSGTKPNPSYSTSGGKDTTDKVFLLSIAEAQNTAYGFTNNTSATDTRKAVNTAYVYGGGKNGAIINNGVGKANQWWLRSPGSDSGNAVLVNSIGSVGHSGRSVEFVLSAVRPAFNLNLSSVLFTSAASGGKPTGTGLTATTAYTGNEYKLTLLDSTRNFALTDTSAKTAHNGDVLSLGYTGATTGANEYISAMLVDANGAVVYYGQLAQAESASGTVSLTVPADIAYGNYTLKLFNEQLNGDYKTDYSSAFVDISLTVGHNYNNGICTDCGAIAPIAKNENGVYEIANKYQLQEFAQIVNGTHETIQQDKAANAILMDNIDMTGIDWTPICSTGLYYNTTTYTDKGYEGTFDGGGHTISNLKITGTDGVKASYGLFGTLSGTVKNLGMSGMTFSYSGSYNVDTTDARAGAIAGQMLDGSLISDCFVVDSSLTPNNYIVGGIAGCNYAGTIQNCYTKNVTISAHSRCGNLVSDTRGDISTTDRPGTVKNCYTDASRVVGTNTSGSEYITGCVANILDSIFASGEITYKLNADRTETVWYQKDGMPAFSGSIVYENICGGDIFYSTTDGDFDSHNIGSDYRCTNCGSYEPATLVTAENYSSLGLDESYVGYYAIENASNLYWYSERERIGDISGSIVLLDDITLDNSKAEWVPIVWDGDCTFDGRGNTITLKLDYGTTQRSENYGLFGTCNYSVVKNLVLDGDLTVNTTGHVGAVAGSMYRTTVSGVISTANVTNTCTTSGSVGGLAGCFGGQHDTARNQYSKIENSAVYANVTGYNAGGLVGEGWGGYQYWDITNAAYVGNVTTNNTTSGTAGAIVGYQNTDNYTSTFTNIYWNQENGLGFYGKRDTENQVYTNTEAKTEAQFVSGEVTWLLNGGVTDGTQVWYQTCEQGLPAFSGETVYQVSDCKGDTVYANTNESVNHIPGSLTANQDGKTHSYTCSVCGELVSEEHTGGTATCAKKAVCDICGSEYGTVDQKAHTYTNGFCTNTDAEGTLCDAYEPAVLTTDKYDVTGDEVMDAVYEISNAGQLYWFANLVNGGKWNPNAVLTENITVNQNLLSSLTYDENGAVTNGDSFRVWTPISNNKYGNGTFDGNNKTVSGLYFNDSATDYVGLFGYVGSSGKVQNVGVIDSYLNGGEYVGGVAGQNYSGTVENCYNTGSVSGSNYVGGVAGQNSGTVQNCYNSGTITGSEYVGGVAGRNNSGTVENCYNTGTVSGGEDNNVSFVGGVAGQNYGTVQNCYNSGTITGGDRSDVGGVAGINYGSGTINNCYNTGTLSGGSYSRVGGVAGRNNSGTVTNCYYLSGTAKGGIYGSDVTGSAEAKTAAQFASGEVTWLLNGGVTDGTQSWYQTCGQGLPAFSGQTVYQVSVTYCDNTSTTAYSNVNENATGAHKYETPTFGWTSDYAECRAVFTCLLCGESESVTCTVTADATDPKKTVYTASAVMYGVTYTDTKEVEAKVVSVTITWTEMSFTYSDGEWNPDTHTYGEGKWTPDAENGSVITVTNNGNVAVNVAFAYTKTVTEVEGSFTDESGNAITSPFALATEEEKKIKLILNGKPSSTFEDTQLGSVTVTITPPEEDES